MKVPGSGVPLTVSRGYNSADSAGGPFGPGWSSSLTVSLSVVGDVATARMDDGQRLRFTQTGGVWAGDPGVLATLTSVPGGYELVSADQQHFGFDASGRLTSVTDRSALGLTFAYDGSSNLASVTDAAGRVATVTTSAGLITRVTLMDGRSVSYGYTSGRLTSVTDVRGETTTYEYDAGGRLANIVDPNGNTEVENTYDSTSGRVVSQKDSLGNVSTFAWDPVTGLSTTTDAVGNAFVDQYSGNVLLSSTEPNGTTAPGYDGSLNPTSPTDARGNVSSATYDGRGNMLTRTAPAPLSGTESWTYDAMNNPLSHTDGRGNTTTYEYDGNGRRTKEIRPGGVTTTWVPDSRGLLTSTTDPRGNTTTYTYDAAGNRTSEMKASGATTSWTFDTAGRVTTMVSPRGNAAGANPADFRTSYTYDADGNLLTETDPLGRVTTNEYDGAGRLTKTTAPDNGVTTYEYNAANEVTAVNGPLGARTEYGYDARGLRTLERVKLDATRLATTTHAYDGAGRLRSSVGPRGNAAGANPAAFTTTYEYDADGNQTKVTDPLGHATTSAYDAADRVTTTTDALNRQTTYDYDENGNRTRLVDAAGGITTSAYDALDRLSTETDPRGNTTTYTYDAAGNRTSQTSPVGAVTTWSYDVDNRTASTVEPRGNVAGANPDRYRTRSEYDADANQTAVVDPLGHRHETVYDAVENPTSVRDANGNMTASTYDPLNRVASVTSPDGATTSTTYSTAGDVASRTDANGHVTTWTYDLAHRSLSESNPIGTWTHTYDSAGNVATDGLPGPITVTYTYDRLERRTKTDYSDTTPDVTWAYDANGNVRSMSDGAGTETYAYDKLGRRTKITRNAQTLKLGYLPTGEIAKRTLPSGRSETYRYDPNGRITKTTSSLGVSFSYRYDPAGNLTKILYPTTNGQVQTNTYDRAGRLTTTNTAKAATVLFSEHYTIDANGNPTRVVDNTGLTTIYGYDNRNWLTTNCTTSTPGATTCTGNPNETTQTYDPVGNRTNVTGPTGTDTFTYNGADQLTARSGPSGTSAFTYDARGNRTTGDGRAMTYNAANQTITHTLNGATTNYTYDGTGKRITATDGANTTNYLWDPSTPLPQVADETGATTRGYINGPTGPIAWQENATITYLHADRLNSTRTTTDSAGNPQRTYRYQPYGTIATQTGSGPSPELLYTGQQQDATGLYHLRARQYDPSTGRFTATDPLARPASASSMSAYAYADNQPTVLVDPTGLRGMPSEDPCQAPPEELRSIASGYASEPIEQFLQDRGDRKYEPMNRYVPPKWIHRPLRCDTPFNWTSDGCSAPNIQGLSAFGDKDKPHGYDFLPACLRHDFGYRNFGGSPGSRPRLDSTASRRHSVDNRLRSDLWDYCAQFHGILHAWQGGDCRNVAEIYYLAVRNVNMWDGDKWNPGQWF